MSEIIGNVEDLAIGDAWVCMYFADGSVQTVHTTTNTEILKRRGVEPRLNYFYDLERMEYTKFRSDSMKIEIMKEKPNYESEVLNFASRFI